MTNPNPTKRRRFRFSLRTMLAVVVLLSLPLGWFALKMREAERQRRAVEAIRKAGGLVVYDYEMERLESRLQPDPPGPEWLRKLVGEDLFWSVVFVHPSSTFADDDMPHLTELTKLETLHLSLTQVTDAGLKHLQALRNVTFVDLRSTQVTDAGLENLTGMTNLGTLYLSDTHVTQEGIKELGKALPNCQIIWDGEETPTISIQLEKQGRDRRRLICPLTRCRAYRTGQTHWGGIASHWS